MILHVGGGGDSDAKTDGRWRWRRICICIRSARRCRWSIWRISVVGEMAEGGEADGRLAKWSENHQHRSTAAQRCCGDIIINGERKAIFEEH